MKIVLYLDELLYIMNKLFGLDFKNIIQKEQKFIANNLKMKKGVIKNISLLENIFTFICMYKCKSTFIYGMKTLL